MTTRRGFLKFLGLAPAAPAIAALPVKGAPRCEDCVSCVTKLQGGGRDVGHFCISDYSIDPVSIARMPGMPCGPEGKRFNGGRP